MLVVSWLVSALCILYFRTQAGGAAPILDLVTQ